MPPALRRHKRPRPLDFDGDKWNRIQKLDERQETSLLLSVADKNVGKLRELVDRCAASELDIDECDPEFGSALELAVTLDDVTAVDILLDGGANPWATCDYSHPESSPIFAAITAGNGLMFHRLCKHAKLGDSDRSRWRYRTMLLKAAYEGQASMVEDILSCCPEWPEATTVSLLERAATNWHSQIIRLGLERFKYSPTDLHVALCRAADFPRDLLDEPPRTVRGIDFLQQQEAIGLLIDAGAEPSRCHNLIINTATRIDLGFALKTLLERGANANERKHDMGTTALHHLGLPVYVANGAKRALHEMGIQLLLDHGADILARDTAGNTPLHYAAFGSNVRLMRLLASKLPANTSISITNLRNNSGETLLHWAAAGKNYKIVSYLLSEGADIECVNNNGWTPLLCAVVPSLATERSGPGTKLHTVVETANLLLEHGADPLVSSAEGWTPLHCVAAHLDTETDSLMAKLATDLIGKGSPVAQRAAMPPPLAFSSCRNARIDSLDVGIWGSRAATYLSSEAHQEDHGAVVQDATPLHWASVHGAVGTAASLKTHGANVQLKDASDHLPVDLAFQSRRLSSNPCAHIRLLQLLAPAGAPALELLHKT